MVPDSEGTSPSEQPGGGDARDLYEELTDDLLYDPAIGRDTMMGYPCVRLAGKFDRVTVRGAGVAGCAAGSSGGFGGISALEYLGNKSSRVAS